ncbi:MAG: type II toxin-antitoxin system VapC family toxin [Alphaproteobacteria bacterium]
MLLDTCAAIWLAHGDPLAEPAIELIKDAAREGGLLVSPLTAWEIGLLSRPERKQPYRFLPDPKTWFARLMALPTLAVAPFTPDIAIDSTRLPPPLHSDPVDRIIIATARHLDATVVTRDRAILDYAEAGHVRALAC